MKLFSIQTPDVWNTLQTSGIFRATKATAEYLQTSEDKEIFAPAYEYMTDFMLLKGVDKPLKYNFNLNTPIWAWYLHNGKHFVDLRMETRVNYKGTCCIELEIPTENVLLSGYETWHYVLNKWYLPENYWDSESADDEHSFKEIEKSWQRCFSPEFLRHETFIQATFFEMRLKWVKNVRFFGSMSGV